MTNIRKGDKGNLDLNGGRVTGWVEKDKSGWYIQVDATKFRICLPNGPLPVNYSVSEYAFEFGDRAEHADTGAKGTVISRQNSGRRVTVAYDDVQGPTTEYASDLIRLDNKVEGMITTVQPKTFWRDAWNQTCVVTETDKTGAFVRRIDQSHTEHEEFDYFFDHFSFLVALPPLADGTVFKHGPCVYEIVSGEVWGTNGDVYKSWEKFAEHRDLSRIYVIGSSNVSLP